MAASEFEMLNMNQPVVIDNGSGVLKAGFAAEEVPKSVFPSYVGTPKHHKIMATQFEGDTFVGRAADDLKGLLKISYPIEHGIVNNWNDMQKVWTHVFNSELGTHANEHPVLLTEAALNPRANREKAAEIFFETFNVPALFISMQAVLSLYASGRTTGMVLDSGDGVTHCVPIYEGFSLPHSISRIDLAGRDITRHLVLLLRKAGHQFNTTAEFEVVRQIKEEQCYVSFNTKREEEHEFDRPTVQSYALPDGSVIELGPERFRAPEILFDPSLFGTEFGGIHEILATSIQKSDLDLRKTLYQNIVLSGGSTMFRGFGDRLLNEVRKLAPKDVKICISAPPERKYSTWIGGSVLASLATFQKMWIKYQDYAEDPSILHRKTF